MQHSSNPHIRIPDAALFQGLSSDDLTLILSRASVREEPRKTVLFRQGERAAEIFLLVSGRVRLSESTEQGHQLLVRFVAPGEVFGDRAAIAGAEYGSTAVTDNTAQIYSWTTETISGLLQEVPRLSANLFAITMTYLRYARERHRLLATASAESRVHWAVTELAGRFGYQNGKATEVVSGAVQSDIADLAVTSIYTVSRVLARYEKRGLLNRTRGRMTLLPTFR